MGTRRAAVAALTASSMVVAAAMACGAPSENVSTPEPTTTTTTATTTTTTTTSLADERPTTVAPPAPAAAIVRPVTAADLGTSWRPGCPVPPERLRRVELNHMGFDGSTYRGDLVVDEALVPEVIEIFEELFVLRFPIEKMRTVDRYPEASDELSMQDNNSSAFNCRRLPGGTGWSLHALGRAIDLNPLQNPYVDSRGNIEPSTAGPFLDRNRTDQGLLRADDPAVRVFTERGWRWGGYWRTPVDYQHFERR